MCSPTRRENRALPQRRGDGCRVRLLSTVGTAGPATRPVHSCLKFCADALNVLPSGFRLLDGDNPADPLVAREWRNVLPLCKRSRVRNENFPQIRWQAVYRAIGDRPLYHRPHSTSVGPMSEVAHSCSATLGIFGPTRTNRIPKGQTAVRDNSATTTAQEASPVIAHIPNCGIPHCGTPPMKNRGPQPREVRAALLRTYSYAHRCGQFYELTSSRSAFENENSFNATGRRRRPAERLADTW